MVTVVASIASWYLSWWIDIEGSFTIGLSDSCPRGLGSYTYAGRAWRSSVDPSSPIYNNNKYNNVLKFFGMAITLWLLLKEFKRLCSKDKLILCLGDNTSTITWIFKSSFPYSLFCYKVVRFVGRKVASIILKSDQFIATQHILRKWNIIVDCLTFKGKDMKDHKGNIKTNLVSFENPPNDVVSHRIVSKSPQLVPQGFKIPHLLSKIFCAQHMVQILKSLLMQEWKKDLKYRTEFGGNRSATAKTYSAKTTQILHKYQTSNRVLHTGLPWVAPKTQVLYSRRHYLRILPVNGRKNSQRSHVFFR